VVNFTLLLLYSPANSPLNPLRRRLGGRLSRSGLHGGEKKLLPIPEIEPRLLGRPARGVAAIPTEPSCTCSALLKQIVVI
jgi:hypothetical protein